MIWTPELIKSLRRRLGWSRAELSRRVGVKAEVIAAWEDGSRQPDSESCNQLLSLDSHVQKYSQSLASDPLAETYLEQNRLNQIFKNDLKNRE